jgi:hypothetical protein
MARRRRLLGAVAAVSSLVACNSVPALTFEQADAGETDATAPDGAAENGEAGEGGDASCPSGVPANATLCCGAVACDGVNCGEHCALCQSCTPQQLCCAKENNVVCQAPSAICH